ncbi:MAG: YceI family protein [Gammaproteobacteria bacterium]|nr:YceI family protein [Gammaproteobacteria bacterium]
MSLTPATPILLRCLAALVLAVLLPACQTAAPVTAGAPAPGEPAPLPPLPPLPVEDSDQYVVDSLASDVRILVYRGGPLANAGHNHVVRVHALHGNVYVAQPFHRSGFELAFPVTALEVDPPDARADEGAEFSTVLSPQAIAATYRNMVGPTVLDVEQYPEITLRSVALIGPQWGPEVTARITLHGVARDVVVPLALHVYGTDLVITGTLVLRTPDFGMQPFSVLGGGLTVQDLVKVRFHIAARQVRDWGPP